MLNCGVTRMLTIMGLIGLSQVQVGAEEVAPPTETEVKVQPGTVTQDGRVNDGEAKAFCAESAEAQGSAPFQLIWLKKTFTPSSQLSFRPFRDSEKNQARINEAMRERTEPKRDPNDPDEPEMKWRFWGGGGAPQYVDIWYDPESTLVWGEPPSAFFSGQDIEEGPSRIVVKGAVADGQNAARFPLRCEGNLKTPIARGGSGSDPHWAAKVLGPVDLDVDSDNTRSLGEDPERDARLEERIEDDRTKLGKVVSVLTDVDLDGVPDYADGYDLDQGSGAHPELDDTLAADPDGTPIHFTPLIVQLPEGLDRDKARIRFVYEAGDPTAVTITTDSQGKRVWSSPGPTERLRVWNRDALLKRDRRALDNQGNYVAPSRPYSCVQLGSPISGALVWRLWIEGLTTGDAAVPIKIEVDSDGDGPAGFILTDTVLVRPVKLEFVVPAADFHDAESPNYDADKVPTTLAQFGDARPAIELEVPTGLSVNASGSCTFNLSGTVRDPIADTVPRNRGADIATVSATGDASGTTNLVNSSDRKLGFWRPHAYEEHFTLNGLTVSGEGAHHITVKTSANALGYEGQAELVVNVTRQQIPGDPQQPPPAPLLIHVHLPEDCTERRADRLQYWIGERTTPLPTDPWLQEPPAEFISTGVTSSNDARALAYSGDRFYILSDQGSSIQVEQRTDGVAPIVLRTLTIPASVITTPAIDALIALLKRFGIVLVLPLSPPDAVAVAAVDDLIVAACPGTASIALFRRNGTFIGHRRLVTGGLLAQPSGVVFDGPDVLHVSDQANSRVLVINRAGVVLRSYARGGPRATQINKPGHLAIVGDEVFAVDAGNKRIQVYNRKIGSYRRTFGTGLVGIPGGIAADADGRLLVSDTTAQRIVIFNNDGNLALTFGKPGTGADKLNMGPVAGVIAYTDSPFVPGDAGRLRTAEVAESGSGRIQRFSMASGSLTFDGLDGVAAAQIAVRQVGNGPGLIMGLPQRGQYVLSTTYKDAFRADLNWMLNGDPFQLADVQFNEDNIGSRLFSAAVERLVTDPPVKKMDMFTAVGLVSYQQQKVNSRCMAMRINGLGQMNDKETKNWSMELNGAKSKITWVDGYYYSSAEAFISLLGNSFSQTAGSRSCGVWNDTNDSGDISVGEWKLAQVSSSGLTGGLKRSGMTVVMARCNSRSLVIRPQSGPIGTKVMVSLQSGEKAEYANDSSITFTGAIIPNGSIAPTPVTTVSYGPDTLHEASEPTSRTIILGERRPDVSYFIANPALLVSDGGLMSGEVKIAKAKTALGIETITDFFEFRVIPDIAFMRLEGELYSVVSGEYLRPGDKLRVQALIRDDGLVPLPASLDAEIQTYDGFEKVVSPGVGHPRTSWDLRLMKEEVTPYPGFATYRSTANELFIPWPHSFNMESETFGQMTLKYIHYDNKSKIAIRIKE